MKRIAILTESELHNIVLEATRYLLNEARALDDAVSIFTKKYPNIDQKELAELMQADPTAVQNDRGAFIGKYGMWIGNQYVNGNIHGGDIPELRGALNTYGINKSRIGKGIAQYQSLDELVQDVAQYDDRFKAAPTMSKGEQGLEKVYEDSVWVVYIPHTYEASRKIGGDTNWCTASSNDYYFNYYTNDGPLYVNVNKKTGNKYQFHFESEQFMDANDDDIEGAVLDTIGASKGLNEFYKSFGPERYFNLIYEFIYDFNEGYARVRTNDKWNWIDTSGNLVWNKPFDKWFDFCYDFKDGYAAVKLNGKYNFIDTDGDLVWNHPVDEWFDEVFNFYNGYVMVQLDNKFNFMDKNGNLLWPHENPDEWFDFAYNFNNGHALVKLNYKPYYLDTDGNLSDKDKNPIEI